MGDLILRPPRFSSVPWLDTLADLRAYGAPETTVELRGGTEIAHGLLVLSPWGHAAHGTLVLRELPDGEWRAAITDVIPCEHEPPPAMDMRLLQSNPRRTAEDGEP